MNGLTILSFGGGQDSTAIAYKLVYDAEFRAKYAPGRLLVVMSDTNNEHSETKAHVESMKAFFRIHGIEFVHITKEMGFHSASWQGLKEFYRSKNAIGSKSYPKTCTDQLKLRPIFRFLETWIWKNYGLQVNRKSGIVNFAKKYGKIRILIGIARGEEKRISGKFSEAWKRQSLQNEYPLVDLGMDRADCQSYIASVGHAVPRPSNCILCPFMSEQELAYMVRFLPADLDEWIQLEAAKLAANTHKGSNNFGVWGRKTLPEKVAEVKAKFADWSNQQLIDYKMSHGHCGSKY